MLLRHSIKFLHYIYIWLKSEAIRDVLKFLYLFKRKETKTCVQFQIHGSNYNLDCRLNCKEHVETVYTVLSSSLIIHENN